MSQAHLANEILLKWNQLTIEEAEALAGNPENLTKMVQAKYGYAQARARREVDGFFWDFTARMSAAA